MSAFGGKADIAFARSDQPYLQNLSQNLRGPSRVSRSKLVLGAASPCAAGVRVSLEFDFRSIAEGTELLQPPLKERNKWEAAIPGG
jgi:hypothetical protein